MILSKLCMQDNIIKAQIFHNVIEGQIRSHKDTFMFKNQLYLEYVFCFASGLFKTFLEG